MKNLFNKKNIISLALLLMLSVVIFGQKKIVYVIGSAAVTAIEAQDQLLIDSIKKWVDVKYIDQKLFNAAVKDTLYTGIDGVIILESCNSKTIVNFGTTHAFPVPCITMEAGLLITWGLITADAGDPSAGLWPYAAADCEAVDIQWKVTDALHPIMKWAGKYKNNDIITWSSYPTPADYGIPYPHSINKTKKVIAVAARTDMGANAKNVTYSQAEALGIFEIPEIKLLYMCAAKTYIKETYGTQAFFNILHESVLYMFDPRPVVSVNNFSNSIGLEIFPNPTTGLTTVTFNKNINSTIILTNLTGQKVAEFIPVGNKAYIETGNFASGLYFVIVENETKKLIIK